MLGRRKRLKNCESVTRKRSAGLAGYKLGVQNIKISIINIRNVKKMNKHPNSIKLNGIKPSSSKPTWKTKV